MALKVLVLPAVETALMLRVIVLGVMPYAVSKGDSGSDNCVTPKLLADAIAELTLKLD